MQPMEAAGNPWIPADRLLASLALVRNHIQYPLLGGHSRISVRASGRSSSQILAWGNGRARARRRFDR